MSEQMQPEKDPHTQQAFGGGPVVLGMSSSATFGSNGSVNVNVMVRQSTTPDESFNYSMYSSIGSAPIESAATFSRINGTDVPFTASTQFHVELVYEDLSTPGTWHTMSGTVDASLAYDGSVQTVTMSDGTNSMSCQCTFGSTTVSLGLDVSSDSWIGLTDQNYTLKGWSEGATATRANVVMIEGTASYTANEAFNLRITYTDNGNRAMSYSGSVTAANVWDGNSTSMNMLLDS